MASIFEDKRIVLAVTGSIAVYKVADLASKLTQAGAIVDVIMTEAATRFIAPLTFQALTGRAVYTNMWTTESAGALPTHVAHVGLGEHADLMIVAPCTANSLAKLANGFSDDLVSLTALTLRCPLIVAPAMDGAMYNNRATVQNVETIKARGVIVIEPDEGRFASGFFGKGRLPETPALMGYIRQTLAVTGPLTGKTVVVTAGGTREAIDPVRYITNHSSGKQGYAIAQSAIDMGANVVLISTVDNLPLPVGAAHVLVHSAEEMLSAVSLALDGADVLVMAAAVADYRPANVASQKIKKSTDTSTGLTIEMTRTPDILMEIKALREQRNLSPIVVGFAAESQDLLTNATSKLRRKGLDFIVANNIMANDAGFQSDDNRVVIISADESQTSLGLMPKSQVAEHLMNKVASTIALRN